MPTAPKRKSTTKAARPTKPVKAPSAAAQTRAYLAALPPATRKQLQGLRAAIVAVAPTAEASFSYGMPGFTLGGKHFIWYAAWKQHTSLYPIGPDIVAALGPATANYETAKGTIRFPLAQPPTATLVRKLVKARMAEMTEVATAKSRAKTTTKGRAK